MITAAEIRDAHLVGVPSATDFYYSKLGNQMLKIMESMEAGKVLTPELRHDIAMTLTLYYEDVMADGGVWHSFTNMNQKLYGKPLPFFAFEGEYIADEPNLIDVKYIIWQLLLDKSNDWIPSPQSDGIAPMAQKLYDLLDESFDNAPVNEELYIHVDQAKDHFTFNDLRSLLSWVMWKNFLTRSEKNTRYLDQEIGFLERFGTARSVEERMQQDLAANMVAIFFHKTGPLGLLPQEWVAEFLRFRGLDDMAKAVDDLECIYYDCLRVDEYKDGKYKFTATNDRQVEVDEKMFDNFENLRDENFDVCLTSLIRFRGDWYVNGASLWAQDKEKYNELKKNVAEGEKQVQVPHYDEIIKKYNGQTTFYFRDTKELNTFFMENKISEEPLNDGKNAEDECYPMLTLADGKSGVIVYKMMEKCIKDPNNPYYDEEFAKKNAMNVIFDYENVHPYTVHELINKGYLPDASENDIFRKDCTADEVRNDLDFLARILRKDFY